MGSHRKGGVGSKLDDIADDKDQTFNEQLIKAQGYFVKSKSSILFCLPPW